MVRLFGCVLACVLVLSCSAQALYAAEYQVNQDGTGDFTAIQAAIDAATDADVIVVRPGTYYENIHFDGKNITLRSLDPEDEQIVASTVIDGGHHRSVVTFLGTEDDTCLLSGFTITNGGSPWGGGILGGDPWSDPPFWTLAGISNCTITGNLGSEGGGLCRCGGTITNCMIARNRATGYYAYGGGLDSCDGAISNCTITDNSAGGSGGGLQDCKGAISNCTITGNLPPETCACGGGLSSCSGTISNCTISRNSAEEGGGLWGCHGTISNCTISGNSAWGTGELKGGGGLYYCYGTISNCTISSNAAAQGGGGVYWCDGTISTCTISSNSAEDGGGLYLCRGTITNCTISGNSASEDGGGLCECVATITNCTISGNSAGYGGGLDLCGGTITNCTISHNGAVYGGGLAYCDGTIGNCVVWANMGFECSGCEAAVITYSCIGGWTGGGEGNISDDPLFVSGPLGDYYLSCTAAGQNADSPCIDSGSASAESLGLDKFTTRTDGVPDAGTVDMGYHYPLTLAQNPTIECSLNSSEFAPGDALVGRIEAHNPGADVAVDAYVAFVLPDGTIVSLTSGGLAVGTHPWVSNVVLPSGFNFGPYEVLRTTVPRSPGDYLFAAALTNPGQFEFIGQPSLFPFTITDSGGHLR